MRKVIIERKIFVLKTAWMGSGSEEWNEGVSDVALGKLEMIAIDRDKLNFLSLIKSFKTNQIIVVEIGVLKSNNTLVTAVKSLEPLRLFWVDHSILFEHNEHEAIEVCKSLLLCGDWG